MHRLSTSFVLGYHGCDTATAEALLAGEPFRQSVNEYDWLGQGVYFWEANPQRGLDFAREVMLRNKSAIKTPAVVGAVIDLGLCLDMASLDAIRMVRDAYDSLKEATEILNAKLPENGTDLLLRRLDCAVITHLHAILAQDRIRLDSIRGIFVEGAPVYPNAGIYSKTHTQIAVRNLGCIKGVFRVPEEQLQQRSQMEG